MPHSDCITWFSRAYNLHHRLSLRLSLHILVRASTGDPFTHPGVLSEHIRVRKLGKSLTPRRVIEMHGLVELKHSLRPYFQNACVDWLNSRVRVGVTTLSASAVDSLLHAYWTPKWQTRLPLKRMVRPTLQALNLAYLPSVH